MPLAGLRSDVHISGDVFFPAERLVDLEHALEHIPVDVEAIQQAVESFYSAGTIEAPGVTPADFGKLITG